MKLLMFVLLNQISKFYQQEMKQQLVKKELIYQVDKKQEFN
jgi:hypothetical protein